MKAIHNRQACLYSYLMATVKRVFVIKLYHFWWTLRKALLILYKQLLKQVHNVKGSFTCIYVAAFEHVTYSMSTLRRLFTQNSTVEFLT